MIDILALSLQEHGNFTTFIETMPLAKRIRASSKASLSEVQYIFGYVGRNPIPSRLFRYGTLFDFMISRQNYEPKNYEWNALTNILKKEICASRRLEKMIYNCRREIEKSTLRYVNHWF